MTRITATDAYKLSMAEAGAALREETFYYSHRRGGANGWHYMPICVQDYIKDILPTPAVDAALWKKDYEYLSEHNYEVGASFRKAFTLCDKLKVNAVPKGAWFYNKEPAFSVTGPSAVASWLEPWSIVLHFRIQVATAAKAGLLDFSRILYATCQREKEIILETLDSVGVGNPEIVVLEQEYADGVLRRAKELVSIVGNPDRIFEVGMRAVSCMEQHEIALRAIKEAGILRTSNVFLSQKLDMIPVGTMGHEHPQRFGDDYDAYIAMRDRFPGFLFYLPDTFDTVRSGIPSALLVISEQPDRDAGIRFDSEHGIRGHYMFTVAKAVEMGLQPRLALESGWNDKLTIEFEELRKMVKWPEDRQAYGYGGYLVNPDWQTFHRDQVSANYKISQSGNKATMKFGDEPNGGKQSIPGRPVVWRPNPMAVREDIPAGFVVQEGEDWKPPYDSSLISGQTEDLRLNSIKQRCLPPMMSPGTNDLIQACWRQRDEAITRASLRSR